MGRRRDTIAEAWQFPQGGIDSGETPEEALYRELREEIGTDKVALVANSHTWLRYELPPNLRRRLWRGRYRGQQQQWYLARFLGQDSDIELDSGLGKPEFLAWGWFALDEAEHRIVPFKQALYREIQELFTTPMHEALKQEALKRENLHAKNLTDENLEGENAQQ